MDEALAILHLTPEDVAANRVGQLSPSQRRQGGRNIRLATPLPLLALGFLAADVFGRVSGSGANRVAGHVALGVLAGVILFAYLAIVRTQLRRSRGTATVTCLTGPVSDVRISSGGRGGGRLTLTVEGKVITIPRGTRSTIEPLKAALSAPSYHVYVLGPGLLSLEPA